MKKNISSDTQSISRIFDFQRFAQNDRLAKIISDVECHYGAALSDDDLTCVNAAGEIESVMSSNQSSDGTEEEMR